MTSCLPCLGFEPRCYHLQGSLDSTHGDCALNSSKAKKAKTCMQENNYALKAKP